MPTSSKGCTDPGAAPSTPTPDRQLTVAIIGAGPLGRWLALQAARSGLRVLLEDLLPGNLHHAREYIRRRLSAAALDGEASGTLRFVSTIEDAVREADLVVDAYPTSSNPNWKSCGCFERMAPPTLFATPPRSSPSPTWPLHVPPR